jgi:hypothetical protein
MDPRNRTRHVTTTTTTSPAAASPPAAAGAPATPAGSPDDDGAPRLPEFKQQYDHYRPLALRVPAAQVIRFHGNRAIILNNVNLGVTAIRESIDRIKTELPQVKTDELLELPDLTRALYFSITQVGTPRSTREIARRSLRMSPVREDALRTAGAMARRGMLPADRVDAIGKQIGRIAAAADAVALASLYIEYWDAIAGKHPYSRHEIEQLGQDGEWLSEALKAKGSRKGRPPVFTARIIRDRLFTLLVQRHAELRRVGAFLFGADVDALVPKLTSRQLPGRPSPAATTPPSAPLAVPAPTTVVALRSAA